MFISDASPERRNLVITATSIIVFYAAGGFFPNTTVRFPVVNVDFRKPEILELFIWGFLVWFQVRFCQATKSEFSNYLHREVREWSVPKPFADEAIEKAKSKHNKEYNLQKARIKDISKAGVTLDCEFTSGENDTLTDSFTLENEPTPWGWVWWGVRSLLVGNAVPEYIVPYVLFVAALSAPYWCLWLGTCGC